MANEDLNYMRINQVEDENIERLRQQLNSIYVIWNKVGVDDEQQVSRANDVWRHINNLLKDIQEEETGLYEDMKERVKNYEKKIADLSKELLLPDPKEVLGSLLVKEEILRQQIDELNRTKHKRLKEFQELHSVEMKYCKVLGMPPLNLSSTTGVPTDKDIYELQQHVNMLKEEKENRRKRFHSLKKELTTILEVTELSPETPLEKKLLSAEEDNLTLSNETFKVLEEFVIKTKSKKMELENEKAALMEKLSILWDVLKITKEEREKFLSKYTCCRVSSINAMKQEIARCEEIKQQNIEEYVNGLREELKLLCEKCFVNSSQLLFKHFQTDEVNDSVLESYDNEVSKWRKYFKDTEHIIRKIKKREELWNAMMVFQNKVNDPNRFKNRGGNLLQEERQRKKLQKDLPALENEIFLDIDVYEKDTGKKFLYYGTDFRIFVKEQWDSKMAEKENEKKTRHLLRTKQLENEITTLKRPMSTPKSAPSKLLKSSHGVSVYRTPNFSTMKQVPHTTARMRSKQLALQGNSSVKVDKKILKRKDVNEAAGSTHSNDTTTYTDFADQLNRSSRSKLRSSVLSSRKIVGTRISINKRKSGNTSTRKSFRKKANLSKITPVRGKLGLPFLI